MQHVRTLVSVYRRTPFFEHYEPGLTALFDHTPDNLTDFNLASIQWVARQLRFDISLQSLPEAEKLETSGQITDLRKGNFPIPDAAIFPVYYQIFSERNSFRPNLSILDLLFSEGPGTYSWLQRNSQAVINSCPVLGVI